MTYLEMVEANKDKIIVEYKRCINDENMHSYYFFFTNLHCEFGLCDQMFQISTVGMTKKREFNKKLQQYQKVTGKKFKLVRTENSLGYTRLVYRLK